MFETKKSRSRRGFFRGSSDRKSSKKQQKSQQKQVQQSQQPSREPKPQPPLKEKKRLSGSQSSSAGADAEPPLGLGGPRQTAPAHRHAYDQRVGEIQYQPSTKTPPHHLSSPPAVSAANIDVDKVHGDDQHEQQFMPQHSSQFQSQQHEQDLQTGTLSFTSQPHQQNYNESPEQHAHQQLLNIMSSPDEIVPQQNLLPQHITPTVDEAVAQLWSCNTGDFQAASHAIRMLRLAIVAEWESQQVLDSNLSPAAHPCSYDPANSFSSLQGATLQLHSHFESMKAERETQLLQIENEEMDHQISSLSSLNGVEWELQEAGWWDVWEESLRASAALSHACVGPSWRQQLKLRQELISESEVRLLHLQHQSRFDVDNISIESMTSTIASMDTSIPHSSGRLIPEQGSVTTSLAWQPPRDILEMLSVQIPEVLPRAMIGFAASVNDVLLPPLRSATTKIYWDSEKRAGISPGSNEGLLISLERHLLDERRWLRRRRQLGDTQRDLAHGLFCAGRKVAETGEIASDEEWLIPGAHTPVARMMIHWLETCQVGLLFVLREPKEGFPFHVEEVLDESPDDSRSTERGNKQPPSGIKDPIRRKFSTWGDIVGSGGIDWLYTLRVLRDCSDLVSVGWRPPPSGRIGEGIILILISIAEKGMSHVPGETSATEEQVHKERLVACSCASESLVAIKNLASRASPAIPKNTLTPLAISLCRLVSVAETGEACTGEPSLKNEILAQRTMATSNAAELLWLLLSNEDYSCPTADALLDVLDMDLHVGITEENLAFVQEHVVTATGAIRALSAAMWGDPPAISGVPSLRFLWEPVVNLFGAVTSSFFRGHDSDMHDASGVDNQYLNDCKGNSPYLNVIIEIILALQRFIDSEMIYGTGDLCGTEWESFVKTIDIGISPWLVCQISGSPGQEIRVEAMTIFTQLTSFLDTCSQATTGFHQIVDTDARNCLHSFLLRKIAPSLMLKPAMVGVDATSLALSVIKSMNVLRYLSFKKGDWAKRASDLLQEAFSVSSSQTIDGHRYIGGYLHHPVVRLEALRSLVGGDYIEPEPGCSIRDADSISSSGISTISGISSIKSEKVPPSLSLFSLTCNQRELHLELVNSIILPRLEETFTTEPDLEKTKCQPIQSFKDVDFFDVLEHHFLLLRFSVKVLGTLFRSRTGEGEKRHHFISLLQSVATSTPYAVQEWVHQREKEGKNATCTDKAPISVSDFLKGEEVVLRLDAIRQLELCLGAPFYELPHSHGNVPDLTKALCDTALFYSTEPKEGTKHNMDQSDRLLMTLASILPLARLSCARSGQGILCSRQHVTSSIPQDILSVVTLDDWSHAMKSVVPDGPLPIVSESEEHAPFDGHIAPFVFVKRKGDSEYSRSTKQPKQRLTRRSSNHPVMDGKQGTIVDFEPIAAAIKHVLNAVSCGLVSVNEENRSRFNKTISTTSISQLPSIVRTICYSSISSFFSYGMAFPQMDDLLWLNLESLPSKNCNEAELFSRSKALSDFAGVLGHMIVSHTGDAKNNLQLCRKVCIVLVEASMATARVSDVQHACCGLISILSSFSYGKRSKGSKSSSSTLENYDAAISDCLISFIDHVCSMLRKGKSTSDPVLIPLIDAMREAISCADSFFEFLRPLRRRVFLILFQLCHEQWEVHVIAFQCAISIVNLMTAKEARLLMFFADDPETNARTANQKRVQPLLIDLVRSRLISKQIRTVDSNTKQSCYRPSLVHKRLANEALCLETFSVDLDDLGRPKLSAWKCGNTILTLRIGSKDSLHRGWIEAVIRSPCSRIRRLIKWKKDCITEHPDSFITLEEQMQAKKSVSRDSSPPDTSPHTSAAQDKAKSESEQFLKSKQNLDILAKARNVIKDFDNLVKNNERHDNELTSISNQSKPTSILGDKSTETIRGEDLMCSSLRRILSDGDLVKISLSNQSEMNHRRKGERSVYSWLKHAIGSQFIEEVIQELSSVLGFSQSTLGVPTSVNVSTSHQDHLLHKPLKPFLNGPNFHRAISILDRVTPFQTYRIALFYGGTYGRPNKKNSCSAKTDSNANKNGDKFLMATQGSTGFWQFAKELGDFVPVQQCNFFSAGLDTSERLSDGSLTLVSFGFQGGSYGLNDPILVDSMAMFHTVTLMPDRVTNRKRHVGNDVVHIVYGLDIDTLDVDHERMAISGHFGFITIYVIPLVHAPLYKICCCLKSGLEKSICSALNHLVGSWLISRRVGAHFVRNLARQADVICQSMIEDKLGLVLNTEDRSRRIKETERHLEK